MRRVIEATVSLILLAVFVSPAEAINITLAEVQNGVAVVQGSKAAKDAAITWEGNGVTQSTKGGSFVFSGIVPGDCAGILSDGVATIEVALANCTPTCARILKTGQTTSYAEGDDGALQRGTPRSYTNNGDGTVTDNSTGLVWEALGNLDGARNPADPHDADNVYLWAEASQKITKLNKPALLRESMQLANAEPERTSDLGRLWAA